MGVKEMMAVRGSLEMKGIVISRVSGKVFWGSWISVWVAVRNERGKRVHKSNVYSFYDQWKVLD
jgi:hypothetical protein